jgi:hypothetical protein
LFIPEYRSAGRQRYCSRPECRKTSRRESQHRWLAKTGNFAYHSGPEHTARVNVWREAHPGYWRRRPAKAQTAGPFPKTPSLSSLLAGFALQDSCGALQNSWSPQVVALIGLISRLRGSALQDIIADELIDIMVAGHAILGDPSGPTLKAKKPPHGDKS